MKTKKKIERYLRAAPKPPAPDSLLERLKENVAMREVKTHSSGLHRWFAPTGDSMSLWRVAAAALIAFIVMLPLSYGAAKIIKYFTIGEIRITVKNSDKINNEEEAQKALEEFGKLYREGKAKEVKPGVWAVTLSNGEEFAYSGPHPELVGLPDAEKKGEPPDATFQDEPAAHALYDKMIETMRNADTLSYESDYRSGSTKQCKYRAWMKKPNYFRLEVMIAQTMAPKNETAKSKIDGILIGDGEYLWLYWPNGRPIYTATETESGVSYSYSYGKSYLNTYLREPMPIGQFSIGHRAPKLGCMSFPIINPSIFHGYTSSFQRDGLIEGIRSMGTEKIGDEECDVIEVSILKGQRCRYLWLSRRDHLPRKLKEVIHLTNRNLITHEVWSKVTVNAEIPMDNFVWKPPEGWHERYTPGPEERLLKPGQEAPNFDLLSADGSRIKLPDYRGKVVWLTFWRVGCPPCLKEMPYLSKLYSKYRDKGLIVLGFNCDDEKQRILDVLRESLVAFPNIVDASSDAKRTAADYERTGVPLNYIIDRQGKVAAAWYGYKDGDKQGVEVLEKLGIK